MSETAQQWVGQIVIGRFPLLRYLGGSGRTAVFLTERYEDGRAVSAAIKFVPSLPECDELQLARWRLGAELSHPHLISIFETGRCELGDAALLYVVMACAEENLADVLAGRPLTPQEAREMLGAVLEALAYLHGKGLVHGHLRPAKVMADGEQVKISSDGLCRAGESNGLPRTPNAYDPPENKRGIIPMTATATPAEDVWSLGITLVEALTQHAPIVPAAAEPGDVQLPQELPEPFLDIARHCLVRHPEGRWTVAEIVARLQGRVPEPHARPVNAAVMAPLPARTPSVTARPRPQQVTPRSTLKFRPQATRRRGYAVPVIVAVGVLAIVVGPRLFRRAATTPGIAVQSNDGQASQLPLKQQTDVTAAAARALGEVPAPGVADKTQNDERAVPVPASVHPEGTGKSEDHARNNSSLDPSRTAPAGAVVLRGDVVERVLPKIPPSAQDGIQGTVRVSVNVDVDSSGSVENAEVASGPSKYFARLALDAARRWRFQPPTVAGRNAVSRWNLRFDFTRSGTTVVTAQDAR